MRAPNFFLFYFACILIFGIFTNLKTRLKDEWHDRIPCVSFDLSVISEGNQLSGTQLYSKYCLTCHQADGTGVRGMFPPLAGNAKVTGSSAELIRIVLFGLKGPLNVNGRDYNQLMPAQAYLGDKQIADILSYIRNNWGNKARVITPEEVGKIRKQGKINK